MSLFPTARRWRRLACNRQLRVSYMPVTCQSHVSYEPIPYRTALAQILTVSSMSVTFH